MPSLKYYVGDFNGILTDLKTKIGADHLTNPRDANAWITFQDCQGSYRDLIKTQKELGLNKPVFTVQHGRGSTTDYDYPNKFPLLADKYLCWGKRDYERLSALGYGAKAEVVGCPLNSHIQPRVPHSEKVVLFVPVNTGKEEPENLMVWYELQRIKFNKAILVLNDNRISFKKNWGINGKINVGFNHLSHKFDAVAKLLPWHDKALYHGSTLTGYQDQSKNNELNFSLLRNVDLVVGLDEGTTEVFAYGHDVPVIIVDGFKYHQHPDGRTPIEIEGYRTPAATHVTLDNLEEAVTYSLDHPEHLRNERAEVAEAELGLSYGNATDNILKFVRTNVKTNA